MNGAGYLDLQVNGYGGIDFQSDELTAEGLHLACKGLQGDGVDGILATVITDHMPLMEARLRRLVALRESDPFVRQMIVGIHIEGPFISPLDGYRGAHPHDAVVAASPDAMMRL